MPSRTLTPMLRTSPGILRRRTMAHRHRDFLANKRLRRVAAHPTYPAYKSMCLNLHIRPHPPYEGANSSLSLDSIVAAKSRRHRHSDFPARSRSRSLVAIISSYGWVHAHSNRHVGPCCPPGVPRSRHCPRHHPIGRAAWNCVTTGPCTSARAVINTIQYGQPRARTTKLYRANAHQFALPD